MDVTCPGNACLPPHCLREELPHTSGTGGAGGCKENSSGSSSPLPYCSLELCPISLLPSRGGPHSTAKVLVAEAGLFSADPVRSSCLLVRQDTIPHASGPPGVISTRGNKPCSSLPSSVPEMPLAITARKKAQRIKFATRGIFST